MKKYGLLGKTLAHSLSPPIHDSIFSHTHLSGTYELFPIPESDIPIYLNRIRAGELSGLNVTIPYKETVMPFLDVISPEAKHIGSVNTICMSDGKLTGYNTDYFGIIKTFELGKIDIQGKSVCILGSGGAARSLVCAIEDSKCKSITIVSRHPKDNPFKQHTAVSYEKYPNDKSQILINSTPVGMYPNIENSPLPYSVVNGHETVVDIVYNPIRTKLLQYARKLGIKNTHGMYMLIAQAVKAQEIWNNTELYDGLIDDVIWDMNRYIQKS